MHVKKKIVLIIITVALVAVGFYYWQNKFENPASILKETDTKEIYQSGTTTESIKNISNYKYTEKYSHPTKKFSFNYPKGFTIASIPDEKTETIVVQNITTKVALQISISPFQNADIDITSEIIKNEIPDMKIDGAREFQIGPSRKGLAFISDNPAFGGKSSEIWFVFKGNLYQISTYYEFRDFLQGTFSTWKFE
ncbi:MAG: hypothetical protein WC735_04375 [Candidatus Paceibacterota bacterium]|jgi:hypothetical protein